MPRPARNQHKNDSQRSSARNTESAAPRGRRRRASHENAQQNSSTRVSPTRTSGRISGGGHIVLPISYDPAPSADRLADLCNKCECIINPEEREANERNAAARRDRCDDCYRSSPAPIAPIGGLRRGQDLGRWVVQCGCYRRSCRWYLSEKHACSSSAVHSREKHVAPASRRCRFCVPRR